MQQSATTLMSMIMTSGGGCAHRVSSAHVDHLVFAMKSNLKSAYEFLKEERPDICIMSAGAHLHDLGDLEGIFSSLQYRFRLMKDVISRTKFIWKVNKNMRM